MQTYRETRSRAMTQQVIEDLQWRINVVSSSLGSNDAAPYLADSVSENLRRHLDVAKVDLEMVAASARLKHWSRDTASTIAVISVVVALALGVFAGVQTYAVNGGLQERVTSLQNQLDAANGLNQKLTNLVNDQVAKGHITVQTVERFLPGGQGLSLAHEVLIITSPASPAENQPAVVPDAITVLGVANLSAKQQGEAIWVLTSTLGVDRVYPQGSWLDGVGPASLDANHHWAVPTVLVGGPGDKGRVFYVIAVLADAQASKMFWQYLETGATTHQYPGLDSMPMGAVEYDRVEVIRS